MLPFHIWTAVGKRFENRGLTRLVLTDEHSDVWLYFETLLSFYAFVLVDRYLLKRNHTFAILLVCHPAPIENMS